MKKGASILILALSPESIASSPKPLLHGGGDDTRAGATVLSAALQYFFVHSFIKQVCSSTGYLSSGARPSVCVSKRDTKGPKPTGS